MFILFTISVQRYAFFLRLPNDFVFFGAFGRYFDGIGCVYHLATVSL